MEAFEPKAAVWMSPMKKGVSNNKVLVDPSGNRLHYKKKDVLKKYYNCSRKDDLQCPVRVSLDIASDMIVAIKHTHNHDNDALESEVKKVVKKEILKAVNSPSVGGRSVMKDIATAVLNSPAAEAGVSYIPSSKTISVTLSRKRKKEKNFPTIPHKWNEMKMPHMFKKTADGQDYTILEERVPGSDALVWGFASKSGLDVMNNSKDWFIDGTFKLVNSTLFKQVWVIVCPINDNNTSIPCAFFLLPSKEYPVYKMVLDCLQNKEIDPPEKIHMDFEPGPLKAVKAVFPITRILTCDFHWKQCLVRHLQKLGLQKSYNEDVEVQTFVRYLWCLSMVPSDQVVSAWDSFVKLNVPEVDEEEMEDEEDQAAAAAFNIAMQQFALYFESTWIGAKNTRNPELPRRKPKYEVKLWNKHQAVIDDEEGTNNRSENWNSVSKLGMNMHPSIWSVLEMFQKEEALARTKIHSLALGNLTIDHPARKKKCMERRSKLRSILAKWGTVSVEAYFNMVASHYNYSEG